MKMNKTSWGFGLILLGILGFSGLMVIVWNVDFLPLKYIPALILFFLFEMVGFSFLGVSKNKNIMRMNNISNIGGSTAGAEIGRSF